MAILQPFPVLQIHDEKVDFSKDAKPKVEAGGEDEPKAEENGTASSPVPAPDVVEEAKAEQVAEAEP